MLKSNQLVHRPDTGSWNRRTFLAGAGALGLSLGASNLLLPNAVRADPKKGGHFRLAVNSGSTTDTLDPATVIDSFLYPANFSLRNNLVELGPDGTPIGELAESWEPSTDATTWTFNLRPGVTFHNGKSLDADDVIASFNNHRGEDSKSVVKAIADQIVDIVALDKSTVQFVLLAGNADWPFIMSDFHFSIVPLNGGELDTMSGIGTGPYVLLNFEPGIILQAERNPNYWKEGRAHFDSIDLINVNDGTGRQNALIAGDVDAIGRVDLKTVDRLAKVPHVRILEVTGTQHISMPMLTDIAPFTDNNVRMALKHAVNRQEILDKILGGHGALGNDHPIAPANRYLATDIPQREYDPDAAAFYLKKAGLDSLDVELSASDGILTGSLAVAQLFSESAKKAGISIKVLNEPADLFWDSVYMKKSFILTPWGGRPTEDWMFSIGYSKDAAWNDTHWINDRFNELLVAARAELDESKRREMYYEMQLLVRDDGGTVIPVFQNEVFAASDAIETNGPLAKNWELDGARATERWSFA